MSFEWDVMLKPEKSASRKRCVDFDLLLGEAYARKKMLKSHDFNKKYLDLVEKVYFEW